ncbi:hypothetical protein Y032_0040g184 [Ancylostoma ceylanicum]|uniref:DUF7083 domain-containing protein n=1 Tax=Ancylostoma ceylanicum TaxID=53326 RepID=A0A016UHU2_9BILA|nr:hypothetical protein Y032_0040g184 [Ancylostoma ceylanicum]
MTTISDEQFQQLLAALTTTLRGLPKEENHQSPSAADPARQFDTLAGRIAQFCYDPDADITFEAWYRRHVDIFTSDAKLLDEATRVRLLLHKLDAASYEKYVSYIPSQTSQHVKFDDAVNTLKELFGPQQSLFRRVNRECAKFKLAEWNENQSKCLIFVCGVQSSEDAFIRLKLLDKIESDPNCTIQILAEECKRLLNIRHDTKMIENGGPAVHSVKQLLPTRQGQQKVNFKIDTQAAHPGTPTRPPPSACWFCADMHFIKDCPYRYPKSSRCRTVGHKEGYCNSSKRRSDRQHPSRRNGRSTRKTMRPDAIFTVANINYIRYRRYATVKVDDQLINFQVDSASDLTVINNETW